MYWSWWFIALLLIAPVGFLALVVVQRIRHHRFATRDVVRSRRAATVAYRALDALETDDSDGEVMSRVTKVLNEFFLDRMGRSVTGLTMEELRSFVMDRGASEKLAGRLVALVETCDHARFAGSSAGHGGEKGESTGRRRGAEEQRIKKEAKELIEELDQLPATAVEEESS
jgi:hypothetical protein